MKNRLVLGVVAVCSVAATCLLLSGTWNFGQQLQGPSRVAESAQHFPPEYLAIAEDVTRTPLDQVRGPVHPWQTLGASREHVRRLSEAIARGDSGEASTLVNEFFAGGPASVDKLLELMAMTDTRQEDVFALGVLLRSAAHFLVRDPEHLAPWTPNTLASTSIDMLGQGAHLSQIMAMGFSELGPMLEPSRLIELVNATATRELGDPIADQAPAITLGRTWAATMSRELEDVAIGALLDPDADGFARGHLAGALLTRDWRHFAPELLRQIAERRAGGESELDLGAVYENLTGAFRRCAPADRAYYFELVSSDLNAALGLANIATVGDAAMILDQVPSQFETSTAHDLLRVRFEVSDDGKLAAGLRVLDDPACDDAMTSFVVKGWLQSGVVATKAFSDALEPVFAQRTSNGGEFWSALNVPLSQLQDYQVLDGIVPWLERSSGENHYARLQILNAVKSRFPALGHLK